jgi:DNA repair protein RadC
MLSSGNTQQTIVSIKELAQIVILANACACIIVHNHPSGNLKPSECDKSLTRRAQDILKLLNIELLDHLILTQEGCFSFSEANLM